MHWVHSGQMSTYYWSTEYQSTEYQDALYNRVQSGTMCPASYGVECRFPLHPKRIWNHSKWLAINYWALLMLLLKWFWTGITKEPHLKSLTKKWGAPRLALTKGLAKESQWRVSQKSLTGESHWRVSLKSLTKGVCRRIGRNSPKNAPLIEAHRWCSGA